MLNFISRIRDKSICNSNDGVKHQSSRVAPVFEGGTSLREWHQSMRVVPVYEGGTKFFQVVKFFQVIKFFQVSQFFSKVRRSEVGVAQRLGAQKSVLPNCWAPKNWVLRILMLRIRRSIFRYPKNVYIQKEFCSWKNFYTWKLLIIAEGGWVRF